jgi:tetratricopeptide (TPR) repeat protein
MFGIRIEKNTSSAGEKASAFLKEATALKKEGKITQAIEKLRQAYVHISKTNTDYGIEVFLRLPLYLQEAGRKDEAWREFNLLLTSGYQNMFTATWSWHLMESKVYDKMRLVMQRDGKQSMAISFGVISYIKELRSELEKPKDIKDESYIEKAQQLDSLNSMLEPLLKKAKKLDKLQESTILVSEWIKSLPRTDDMIFEKKLIEIINL